MLKELNLKDIIYQKLLSKIITSLLMETTLMTKQMILIKNDLKKLEN